MKVIRNLFVVISLFFAAAAWAEAININTADAATLEGLNGIGPAKAQAIIEYREQNGPFESVDQLAEVEGIGGKTLEMLKPEITIQ